MMRYSKNHPFYGMCEISVEFAPNIMQPFISRFAVLIFYEIL